MFAYGVVVSQQVCLCTPVSAHGPLHSECCLCPGTSAHWLGLWVHLRSWVYLGMPMSLNVSAHVWVHEAMGLQGSLCSCAHAWQCFCLCNVSRWVPMDFLMCQLVSLGSCAFTSGSLPAMCHCVSACVSMYVCLLVSTQVHLWEPVSM